MSTSEWQGYCVSALTQCILNCDAISRDMFDRTSWCSEYCSEMILREEQEKAEFYGIFDTLKRQDDYVDFFFLCLAFGVFSLTMLLPFVLCCVCYCREVDLEKLD